MGKKLSKQKPKKDAFASFARDKKTLKGPFTQVAERSPGLWEKSSWHDIQMPEYLWVALILGAFDEDDAITRLRTIGEQWPSFSTCQQKPGQWCRSAKRQFHPRACRSAAAWCRHKIGMSPSEQALDFLLGFKGALYVNGILRKKPTHLRS